MGRNSQDLMETSRSRFQEAAIQSTRGTGRALGEADFARDPDGSYTDAAVNGLFLGWLMKTSADLHDAMEATPATRALAAVAAAIQQAGKDGEGEGESSEGEDGDTQVTLLTPAHITGMKSVNLVWDGDEVQLSFDGAEVVRAEDEPPLTEAEMLLGVREVVSRVFRDMVEKTLQRGNPPASVAETRTEHVH